SVDTTGRPRERILGRIIRKLHHGAIILLHADREESPELAEGLLAELESRGYRCLRVDEFDK
ncbi:MAG: polysaccharide deacetylase family protein, partial [Rikenellaceae bacterium]|nr:polysaccharide deacetylase family protein [Rikenellaceae bacterium]